MNDDLRQSLISALTFDALARGEGGVAQRAAYEELEWRRCAESYEYWRVHYACIILKSGAVIPWTEPYPMQIASAAEWANGDSTMEVKSRQLGETTNGTHFALWECMFKDAVIWNFFGADDDASKDMKRRLDATLDRLPAWMLARARRTSGNDADTTKAAKRKQGQEAATIMTFGLSMIRVFTGSVKKAQGLTGKTLWDDAGKHTDPERKWQLLYPTIDDPDPKNRGQVIIIFNGNGEDFLFKLFQQAKRSAVSLKPHFYSWRDDPRRTWAMDEKTLEGPRCILATKREVWPWYDNAKAQYMIDNPDRDEMAFKAQYPETEDEAFYISSDSRFDNKVLSGMELAAKRQPSGKTGLLQMDNDDLVFHENGRVGHLRLYEAPDPDGAYVIGVDPAGGHASSDYSTMQCCRLWQRDPIAIKATVERLGYDRPPTVDGTNAFDFVETLAILEQVATYQARCEPTVLANQAMRLGKWYNNALVVVESISHGGTVIEHMKQEYWNLYREERTEKFADEESERIGFWPQAGKQTVAVDNLAAWLANAWLIMRDPATLKELKTFGYQVTNGGAVKLGAPSGMHDDLVDSLSLVVVGAKSLIVRKTSKPKKVWQPWEW